MQQCRWPPLISNCLDETFCFCLIKKIPSVDASVPLAAATSLLAETTENHLDAIYRIENTARLSTGVQNLTLANHPICDSCFLQFPLLTHVLLHLHTNTAKKRCKWKHHVTRVNLKSRMCSAASGHSLRTAPWVTNGVNVLVFVLVN